jgi:curved DNA-binding protein CbpA
MIDYYLILGININSDKDAIKKAFRTLSKKYHPDINPGGAEQFKNINEANSILSDLEKRKVYDNKFKAAFSSSQNKNANSTTNNTHVKTKSNTNNTSFTKTYTPNNGTQSTIIVNGVKINVTGNNTTVNVVNGKVIIETRNY